MVKFEMPELGYEYDALEPYIDAKTMEIHYTKHHKAYLDKFNAAIENKNAFDGKTAEEIVADLDNVPEEIKAAVRNNGGGFVNHKFFWPILKKNVPFEGEVADAIKKKWGSFDSFKEEFSKAAATRFGSGWAWLGFDKNGELHIESTANQDTPISKGHKPILALDVWEHAYYLNYQNRRPEYIEAFFKVINWKKVNEHYLDEVKR